VVDEPGVRCLVERELGAPEGHQCRGPSPLYRVSDEVDQSSIRKARVHLPHRLDWENRVGGRDFSLADPSGLIGGP
jgi:hypothetical protein